MVEWQDGGRTDAENLQALCRKHHALKSLRLWTPQRSRSGHVDRVSDRGSDVVWVSPLGGRALAGPVERYFGKPMASSIPERPPSVPNWIAERGSQPTAEASAMTAKGPEPPF